MRLTKSLPLSFWLFSYSQAFFAEHKEFAANDFYITGESYAGHYIPAFAARVHEGNKGKQGIHINLKVPILHIFPDSTCFLSSILLTKLINRVLYQGFAIGNGLTNPEIQYKAYTDYALEMGLIGKSDFNKINKLVPACEKAIKICGNFLNIHKSFFRILNVMRYDQVSSLWSALLCNESIRY